MEKRKTISSRDFFEMFEKSKSNNFRSLGYFKKDRKISFHLWRKILIEYFKVYFYELFFFGKAQYFFLGGKMSLCRIDSKQKTRNGKKYWTRINPGIFWYWLPCERFMKSVKIAKLMGSTNQFPKLQELWLQTNNPEFLRNSNDLKLMHLKNKTYYRK